MLQHQKPKEGIDGEEFLDLVVTALRVRDSALAPAPMQSSAAATVRSTAVRTPNPSEAFRRIAGHLLQTRKGTAAVFKRLLLFCVDKDVTCKTWRLAQEHAQHDISVAEHVNVRTAPYAACCCWSASPPVNSYHAPIACTRVASTDIGAGEPWSGMVALACVWF